MPAVEHVVKFEKNQFYPFFGASLNSGKTKINAGGRQRHPAGRSFEMDVKQAELRWAFKQAHASSRIEGHIPDPLYLADCEAVIAGTMTMDEARAASLKRALAEDRAVAGFKDKDV